MEDVKYDILQRGGFDADNVTKSEVVRGHCDRRETKSKALRREDCWNRRHQK